MPDVTDILVNSAQSIIGYSAWVLQPSGIAVHSFDEAIAETINHVAEAKIGYSAWILQPSGLAVHTIDEVIIFTPTPEPTPAIITGGVGESDIWGGGPWYTTDVVTSEAVLFNELVEKTITEEIIITASNNKITTIAKYRRPIGISVPIEEIAQVEKIIAPKTITFYTPIYPDELSSGILSINRKKIEEELLLYDII
jgi:hypothetical protein